MFRLHRFQTDAVERCSCRAVDEFSIEENGSILDDAFSQRLWLDFAECAFLLHRFAMMDEGHRRLVVEQQWAGSLLHAGLSLLRLSCVAAESTPATADRNRPDSGLECTIVGHEVIVGRFFIPFLPVRLANKLRYCTCSSARPILLS